jgi:Flp pilus assembly pilin Flp
MAYRLMGRLHAAIAQVLARERGQGTVEYVALILLVAVVLAGVVTATRGSKLGDGQIAATIVKKLKGALESVK